MGQIGDPDDAGKTQRPLGRARAWQSLRRAPSARTGGAAEDRGRSERKSVINADLPTSKSKPTTDVTFHPYPSFFFFFFSAHSFLQAVAGCNLRVCCAAPGVMNGKCRALRHASHGGGTLMECGALLPHSSLWLPVLHVHMLKLRPASFSISRPNIFNEPITLPSFSCTQKVAARRFEH